MSTNYFIVFKEHEKDVTTTRLHLGVSLYGWCFLLRKVKYHGLQSPKDWYAFIKSHNALIINEYGEVLSVQELTQVIEHRTFTLPKAQDDFLQRNHAFYDEAGFLRHKIDGDFCVLNGDTTWDLIESDFF